MNERLTTKKYSKFMENRGKLILKIDKQKEYEPSKEELKNAYGYLDYCIECGKQIRFGEAYSHGFLGNAHKFGCSIPARIFGYVYNFFKIILILILIIPFGIYEGIKWIIKQLLKKADEEKGK